MKKILTALGLFVALTSVASSEGTRHIKMHIENNTSAVLVNPTTNHNEVNIKGVQPYIEAHGSGEIEFQYKDTANKAKMNVTYQIYDDASQAVEFKYEASFDGEHISHSCSVEAPFPSSYNDCNHKDVHYYLNQ